MAELIRNPEEHTIVYFTYLIIFMPSSNMSLRIRLSLLVQ
jgi:hypothetical protein